MQYLISLLITALLSIGAVSSPLVGADLRIITVPQGGTGTSTVTAAGVVYGNGTSAIRATAACADGEIIKYSSGIPACGSDSTGVGGSITGLSTTTPIAGSNVLVYSSSGAGAAYGVATGTVSSGTGISLDSSIRSVIGGALQITNSSPLSGLIASFPFSFSNPTLTWLGLSTTTDSGMSAGNLYVGSGGIFQTAASSSIFGYTPLNPTRQLTIAGTAQQLTSSAGAQTLEADRTWTLSFPSHVIFPGSINTQNATATNATTTSLAVTNLNSASCDVKASTSGVLSCGTDATGSGGTGLSTTTPISDSNVLVYSSSGAGAAYGVATGTVSSANSALTVTSGRSVIGGSLSLTVSTTTTNMFSGSSGQILLYNNGWFGAATSTLGIAIGDTTGTLSISRGGTGSTTAPVSQLLYGGASAYQSVATTSASCSGNTTCSSFTVIGNTPITISSTGGGAGLSTTSPTTNNEVLVYNSAGAGAAYSIATTSLSMTGPFNIANPIGVLKNGTVTYWGLATTSQPSSSNLLVSNGAAGVYSVATGTVSAGAGISLDSAARSVIGGALQITNSSPLSGLTANYPFSFSNPTLTWLGLSTTTNSGMSAGNLYVGSGGIFQTAASSSIFGYTPEQPLTFSFPLSRSVNAISSLFSTTTNNGMSAGFLYSGSGGIWQSAASSSLFGYTPLNPTRQIAVAGTAQQITSSAGAQTLEADRTWTLSFPSHVVFPGSINAGNSTTTNATSTSLAVLNLNAASCDVKASTSGVLSCGTDATGVGGSTPDSKWATSTNNAIYPSGLTNSVVVGTTTQYFATDVCLLCVYATSTTGDLIFASSTAGFAGNLINLQNAAGFSVLTINNSGDFTLGDSSTGNNSLEFSPDFFNLTKSNVSYFSVQNSGGLPILDLGNSDITITNTSNKLAITGGVLTNDNDVGIATTTPEARLDVWGANSGKIVTFFSDTGTKFLELLNTGVATVLGVWDFGGATSVEIPNGTGPTVDATGEIAVDTTGGQFAYFDGIADRRLSATTTKSFNIASSTLDAMGNRMSNGTSTFQLMNSAEPLTLLGFYCVASTTGSVMVRFGDGANWTTEQLCTSGAYTVTTSNNTFTSFEAFMVQASSTASTNRVQRVTVTPHFRFTAQ